MPNRRSLNDTKIDLSDLLIGYESCSAENQDLTAPKNTSMVKMEPMDRVSEGCG